MKDDLQALHIETSNELWTPVRVAITRLFFRLVELVAFQQKPLPPPAVGSTSTHIPGHYTENEWMALRGIWKTSVDRDIKAGKL